MPGFVKAYPDAAIAAEALRRSAHLRAAGVPTPVARPGAGPRKIRFDRIAGTTGPALLGSALEPLLRPIANLHAITDPCLPRYDPFLRIRPRLSLTGRPEIHALLASVPPTGAALLHGDLHLGQVIRDRTGRAWLIDLDDLAIGAPEADLANLTAWLATALPKGDLRDWTRIVLAAWHGIGQTHAPESFGWFLGAALVRRHLKLRERGRPDHESMVLRYLRDRANFSIR